VTVRSSETPLSAVEQARLVRARTISPVELCERTIDRISVVQPRLNCLAHLWADDALEQARSAAESIARDEPVGPLHGVPVLVKETTPVCGRPWTMGSLVFRDTVADRDATIVRSLRAAGAVIVGATTSPEFAHTLQTDSPLWGVTRNPWNPRFTPGGSSGGSGAAVASGCVALAEGTDMGGSVRIPAAWSGVVGLKPGIGRIPMDVLPGLFDSLSHHGPLASSVDDARLFLACTQGPDESDPLSLTTPLDLRDPTPGDVRGMRLGLSIDLGSWWVHPEIVDAVEGTARALETAGAIVEPVDVQFGEQEELLWLRLWGVFMSGYYGHLVDEHADELDPDVVRLVELGRSLSATELKRLEIERSEVWRRMARALAGRDALICPTMATPPLPAAKADREPTRRPDDGRCHAADMTALFNLVGPCPAMSVPCGVHTADPYSGMPIGLQIVGQRWREDVVLRVGRAVELARPEFTLANSAHRSRW
jgi:Asp-tRNA(Asn)/Glu-tRNA(Gln) amidotransferase A subunit family amidase